MNKKRIAFIGGGIDSGIGKIHFNSISLSKNWMLYCGIFSKNINTNKSSGKLYNVPKDKIFYSLEDMIKKEQTNIDAFVIVTPIFGRYALLKNLSKLRIPIICEKPVVGNLIEIEKLIKLFKKNHFFVTYNYTGYPMLREIKQMTKKNFFGNLKSIFVEMPSGAYLNKNTKNIAKWRLLDKTIPTFFLDLGSHVFNLINFITDSFPKTQKVQINSFGKFKNIYDDLMSIGKLKNGITYNVWFSKSAIGYDNGLKIRIFGDKGSAQWSQMNPEILKVSTFDKKNFIISRSSYFSNISNEKRYNDFKSGHPDGYQQAFKNIYDDIFSVLKNNKSNKYVFDLKHAKDIILTLNNIAVKCKIDGK